MGRDISARHQAHPASQTELMHEGCMAIVLKQMHFQFVVVMEIG